MREQVCMYAVYFGHFKPPSTIQIFSSEHRRVGGIGVGFNVILTWRAILFYPFLLLIFPENLM